MTVNPHLKAYLDNYLALPNPGFAIMINVPWGAGKSHAIKPYYQGKDALYVSLFGAKSAEDIDRAILMERLPLLDNALTKGLGSLGGTALRMFRVDFKPEALAQIALPTTLIFDDLERAGMTVPELFGHLNGFVEHQGKRVIVLANEEELQSKHADYAKYKEKTVGRTLRLHADVASAFPAFLAEITDPATKSTLEQNQARILEVFSASTFENLRLLRHAMLEFVQLYAALDEDMRARSTAVSDLIATYFALHMEYGKGALSRADLEERGGWRMVMGRGAKSEKEAQKSTIEMASEKYARVAPEIYFGQALPRKLAIDLIVDGHAEAAAIRSALKSSNGFADLQNETPWRTLWWWRQRSEDQCNMALRRVETDLANHCVTDPHVLMQIFGIFLGLAKEDGLRAQDAASVVSEAKAYIDALQNKGILPPWDEGTGRGELIDRDAYDGLGYPNRNDAEFADILNHLKAAMSAQFLCQAKAVAAQLLENIPAELDHVIQILTRRGDDPVGSGYLTAPILTYLDPAIAAARFSQQAPAITEALFKALVLRENEQIRRQLSRDICDAEAKWLRTFRLEVERLAEGLSPFRKAQLKTYIRWHLVEITEPPSRRS